MPSWGDGKITMSPRWGSSIWIFAVHWLAADGSSMSLTLPRPTFSVAIDFGFARGRGCVNSIPARCMISRRPRRRRSDA